MTYKLLKRILWDQVVTGKTYLYGSDIVLLQDALLFTNHRMPSGKVLSKWVSRTNYQGDRKSPDLPVLHAGRTYQIRASITSVPQNRYYLLIEFFNRQNENIGFVVQRESEQEFVFPEEAFTYSISLMGSGCHNIDFSYIDIYHDDISTPIHLSNRRPKKYIDTFLPDTLDLVRGIISTL